MIDIRLSAVDDLPNVAYATAFGSPDGGRRADTGAGPPTVLYSSPYSAAGADRDRVLDGGAAGRDVGGVAGGRRPAPGR
jgi:hypothetical protein